MGNKWKLEETDNDEVLLTNGKVTMATSNVEDEYLRAILVLLNNCGGDFHSENELEIKLGVELHIASYELEQFKARCDRYEKERHEMRLAMRMLLRAFMHVELSRDQEKYYKQADAIFKKYHNVTDVLRNEALSGEGEKEVNYTCNKCGNENANLIKGNYCLCDECMRSPEHI